MKNLIQKLEDKFFSKSMANEPKQAISTQEAQTDPALDAQGTSPVEAPADGAVPPAPVEENAPDNEPPAEEPAAPEAPVEEAPEVDPEDRSAYNCSNCGGSGLVSNNNALCGSCHGTGKVQ